ncbi:MAG: hypothetical protein QOD37_591 [Gaiellales bacterium]|nr:hypothetical protein [Gaiellales bacterium]
MRKMTTRSPALSARQAAARITASLALGGALAVAIVSFGVSASGAVVRPGAPGTAASRLGVLHAGPFAKGAPPDVSVGLGTGSADPASAQLLGSNAGGSGLDLYAAGRSNGGACNALASPRGGVSTQCVDDLPPSGISLQAADATGWTLYGFAADAVVGVDVILNGSAQPATMLHNAYAADLGAADLGAVSARLVHYADGTTAKVANDLRAPGA